MRQSILFSLICVCVLSAGVTMAQMHQHGTPAAQAGSEASAHTHPGENLGAVTFPTSCAGSTATGFGRGVALLHSFWYPEAERQFRAIAAQDPKCAMAHWGIAMSWFHQLWDRPNDTTIAHGREEMQKAQELGAATPRERAYIAALSAFYAGDSGTSFLTRAKTYSDGMARVYEQYPSDKEAGAFYALSLLASAAPDDSSLANQKKAVAVLNRLFEQDPNHPGLAHYIIHSCDNPRMAQDGLAAARRYAAIASSSPHALHMPSHIFSRLGLWQEDAASNRASIEATRRTAATMGQEDHQLHAMDFLIYAELQMGNDDAAQRDVEEGIEVARRLNRHPSPDNMGMNYYAIVEFQAIYDLETRRWADAAAIEPATGSSAQTRGLALWAKTIGAARSGNTAAAETSLALLSKVVDEMRSSPYAFSGDEMDLFRDEAAAWLAFAQHKPDDAIAAMRRASESEDEHGTAEVAIPARQMLGDLLLELGRPQDALGAFETSNRNDPNRFNTLYGAVRAARRAGQANVASRYLDQLLKTCASASSARVQQIRSEARAAQSAKPAPSGGM